MHFLTPKEQQWRNMWPAGLIALVAVIQLVSTFIIIGLEVTSMVFDIYHSMIFAGYFCSFFFTLTWISMFTVTCCNRHSFCCATHVLVENILSVIAASVLIYFDNLFLHNPYTCLYGSTYECSGNYDSLYYSNTYSIYSSTGYTVKMACIKAQLAFASLMLLTNVIYIIIFIVVAIKTRHQTNQVGIPSYGTVQPAARVHPTSYAAPATTVYVTPILQEHPYQGLGQRTIECHNCHTQITIA